MTFYRLFRACFAVLLIGTLAATNLVSATTTSTNPDGDYFLYIPTNAAARGPLQVLVTVHGMGGDGKNFCQNLISRAEQNGWIIVAPTFQYQDYHDPNLVLQDDTTMLPHLKQIIDNLPAKTGLQIKDKVLLYGFSRGAQIVHRFAEFYPDRTLAVAFFSAGSYTLPTTTLNFPFGVGDIQKYTDAPFNASAFARVPFFVGVGGADNNPADTPRAWDQYLGTTRIARAQSFDSALTSVGQEAPLTIFPNVSHDVTSDMRGQAMAFLEQHAVVQTLIDQSNAVGQAYLTELAA